MPNQVSNLMLWAHFAYKSLQQSPPIIQGDGNCNPKHLESICLLLLCQPRMLTEIITLRLVLITRQGYECCHSLKGKQKLTVTFRNPDRE